MVRAMVDEVTKIAAVSSPAIKAPPAPGGIKGQLNATPAAPVPLPKIVGKALESTNLQKTNYSSVQTRAQTPNVTLTSEQKALAPPVVRS
jgi:hypothetical protein